MRQHIAGKNKENKDRIRWRSNEVHRIEAFTDAVFAFAITLLIVSLEVPKTFHELIESMKGFWPFALCFALLFQIWYAQCIFFRRYGLTDTGTIVLNGVLLFVVLFFVYPLKFLSSFSTTDVTAIAMEDIPKLMRIYGLGYASVWFLFILLYMRAYKKREELQLSLSEIFETRTSVYHYCFYVSAAVLSILITFVTSNPMYSGWIYALLATVGFLHRYREKIHCLKYESIGHPKETDV